MLMQVLEREAPYVIYISFMVVAWDEAMIPTGKC